MLCLKKRRTYSFTQGVCADLPRRSKKDDNRYEGSLNMAITTLPRKSKSREATSSGMVLTVTEDTPADMLAGSMELLVQLPREHHLHTQRVTVQRSTPMMDLLVQIATAHKLAASSYTLQAIGERGLVLPHQPNTPIGALDALQVKLLPKQGTFVPRKTKQAVQPFETTFRLQVHLPRNQLYVSRVSPKMNLGEILDEVCREKNLDKNKYELRHPGNLEEVLDLSLSLQDYHLQEVTLYAKQGRTLGSALSSQDIMALQRQEERRRQQAKQSVFGFMFKKSKESSLSTDSLGGRSVSPARSDETARSGSPLQPPARPQRKRRPAPKPPVAARKPEEEKKSNEEAKKDNPESKDAKEKMVISHSRNSSDSSGYHEASVLSDNPDSAGRLPETLPRRSRAPAVSETSRKLAHTSQSSKSLGNLAATSGTLSHGISSTSLSSTGQRKKRAAPPPPVPRPLSSAVSTQALERIVDSEESLTSDMDPSKPPSDIGAPSKASSDIEDRPKASSDIGVTPVSRNFIDNSGPKKKFETMSNSTDTKTEINSNSTNEPVEDIQKVENARVTMKREPAPVPKPRKTSTDSIASIPPVPPKRRIGHPSVVPRIPGKESNDVEVDFSPSSTCVASKSQNPTDTSRDRKHENSNIAKNIEETKPIEQIANVIHDVSNEKISQNQIKEPSNHLDKSEHVKIMKNSSPIKKDNLSLKLNHAEDKTMCSIISTIPKCDHLDIAMEHDNFINKYSSRHHEDVQGNKLDSMNSESEQKFLLQDQHFEADIDSDGMQTEQNVLKKRGKDRAKIFRSQSKLNDFETDIFKKQRRHLTSHPEDITFAMNLNVSSESLLSFEEFCNGISGRDRQEKIGDNSTFYGSKGLSDADDTQKLSETDILLQKVSDTLSNTLPVPPSTFSTFKPDEQQEISSRKTHVTKTEPELIQTEAKLEAELEPKLEPEKSIIIKSNVTESNIVSQDLPDTSVLKASTPNITVASQQDTSDYVSAVSDDLSITDWEYQLPAPPTAFRDVDSPVYDGYDTITLSSVEAFKEIEQPSQSNQITITDVSKQITEPVKQSIDTDISSKTVSLKSESLNKDPEKSVTDFSRALNNKEQSISKHIGAPRAKENINSSQKETFITETSINLKKEVINELESKIEIGALSQNSNKEIENRRTIDRSAKIAPIDNTLSNFTITTYTKQKSLDIFDENEDQTISNSKNSDDRTIKTFATLSRNKNPSENGENKNIKHSTFPNNVSNNKNVSNKINNILNGDTNIDNRAEPKNFVKTEVLLDDPVNSNEKINIHRSKSYIAMANNEKYVGTRQEYKEDETQNNSGMRRATSITGLNVGKSNEKFSQWRDNILKRQEDVTKEKQLQSLQVLKSILPQLKNAQQAEENVSKEYNNVSSHREVKSETMSNEHPTESNAVSTRESQATSDSEHDSKKSTQKEPNTKRYTYAGPPTINLGSWSERPCVNVQIKMDTDYKFDRNSTATSRTVVNINGTEDKREIKPAERNGINHDRTKNEATSKNQEKNGLDELARKVISHTTASGFKKPQKINVQDSKSNYKQEDRPVVTGVEFKKSIAEKTDASKNDEVKIDTSSVNFKDLTRAFGQDVCLRPKPKRVNVNRNSDYFNSQSDHTQIGHESESKGNRHGLDINAAPNRNERTFKSHSLVNAIQNSNRAKKYTSVIGIHSQNQNGNFIAKSNGESKINQPMPVVKGFKIQTTDSRATNFRVNYSDIVDSAKKESTMPKPPTMPVITGVTLKSANARPKSMPVHVDSRDILLESIRNFGGREKLKSVRTLT